MVRKTQCETLSHYDELKRPILKKKYKYSTHEKAVKAAKKINLKKGQVHKVVTYKCKHCHEYHIGKNGTKITPKYRAKLLKEQNKRYPSKIVELKVVGKIDLD